MQFNVHVRARDSDQVVTDDSQTQINPFPRRITEGDVIERGNVEVGVEVTVEDVKRVNSAVTPCGSS